MWLIGKTSSKRNFENVDWTVDTTINPSSSPARQLWSWRCFEENIVTFLFHSNSSVHWVDYNNVWRDPAGKPRPFETGLWGLVESMSGQSSDLSTCYVKLCNLHILVESMMMSQCVITICRRPFHPGQKLLNPTYHRRSSRVAFALWYTWSLFTFRHDNFYFSL